MKPGIEALYHAYAAAKLSPLDVFEDVRAQVQAADAPAHVFTTLTLERARQAAQASNERWREGRPLGPLDGIPVVWKDAFDMAGTVTSCGSRVMASAEPAQADAALVSQMERLGVLSIGKTTLSEFAYSGLGINLYPGTPRNPADPRVARIPGGSSSGSAVAVSLGWVPCGMGSDTSGSIRVPAALQGLVGFKPSHGRYAAQGIFPLAPSLDTAGPLLRSVADACLLDTALTGRACAPAGELSDWTFIVPSGQALAKMDAGVQAAFEAALESLARAGAQIMTRAFRPFEMTRQIFDEYGTLVAVEATKVHKALMASPDFDKVDQRIAARMRKGAALPQINQERIQSSRASLVRMASQHLTEREVLIYPTVPMTAPKIVDLERDDALFAASNMRILHNTMLGSYLDMPTLNLPVGLASDGLPVGISLSMATGEDARLLGLGLAAQRALQT